MKYKIGDIVVIEHVHKKITTAIISDSLKNYNIDSKYFGYTDNHASLMFNENDIISYGSYKDIITDHILKQTLDKKVTINEFFKIVMIHLIWSTDKYDLQILNKCQYIRQLSYGPSDGNNVTKILSILNTKMQLDAGSSVKSLEGIV